MTYTVESYFDEKSLSWAQTCEPAGPKHLTVAYLAGIAPGARVLDVGCGTGIMVDAYLQLGAKEVLGVDLSAGMIAQARTKYAHEPRVRFLQADVLSLPVERDSAFDVAVIYNAYPHFADKEALAEKIYALVKPEGRFLVAHGMGRHALNHHHSGVPAEVTRDLQSASVEHKVWTPYFGIDQMVDCPHFYCFGGPRR